MAEVQIKRLSHRHHEILMYMVANPTAKLGDVAAEFGVTQPHLSIVIHSDIFQEELTKKLDGVWHPLKEGLNERLTGMAHLVLDKLENNLENDKFTPGQLIEMGDSVLDRLGYGTKSAAPQGGQQTNVYIGTVPGNVLADARETFGKRVGGKDEGKVDTPAVEEQQAERADNLDAPLALPLLRED